MKAAKYRVVFLLIACSGAAVDILSKFLIFLYWQAIVMVPMPLFAADVKYRKDLENHRVSAPLRRLFSTNGHKLPVKVTVATIRGFQAWWLGDSGEKYRYFIESGPKNLRVYRPREKIPGSYRQYPYNPRLYIPQDYQSITIVPGLFDLRIAFNLGAVWSSFHGQTIMLTLFSVAAIVFILYLVVKNDYSVYYQTALGLITSGALGNLWDRLYYGGVRDFLDFHWGQRHWPTFNLADSFIVIGIAIFLVLEWKSPKDQDKRKKGRNAKRHGR